MDFKKVCRICLDYNQQAYDIYTSYYAKVNRLYSDMISDCTKLKPYQGDGLPKLICKSCSRQLKRAYTFSQQCEASDKQLRHYRDLGISCTISNGLSIKTEEKDDTDQAQADSQNGTTGSDHDLLMSIVQKQRLFEQDVKHESGYLDGQDSGWDAEDDNVLLGHIKSNKSSEELTDQTLQPNKKKGRKTKKGFAPSSKLPHQCDVCGKVLSTKSNMKAHRICHTDLRPFQCESCPANFRGHSALFQHKKTHTGETPYHCSYCPKRFSRRTGLINHIRVHTGEKQYSCEICLKTFVQHAQLSIHLKRHKGDKAYLCQECGKGFPIKADLKVHQRIHNGEKPYSCHMCTKTFATSGNLSIHIRIHNKEVRYHCPECERGFVTRSAFSLHVKRHKGQRDYACECGKRFYTSSALKQHRVVHTGEKKYQCKICERKFTQTSHLSRHFKRDHAKLAQAPPSDYKVVLSAEPLPLHSGAAEVKCGKCEGP